MKTLLIGLTLPLILCLDFSSRLAAHLHRLTSALAPLPDPPQVEQFVSDQVQYASQRDEQQDDLGLTLTKRKLQADMADLKVEVLSPPPSPSSKQVRLTSPSLINDLVLREQLNKQEESLKKGERGADQGSSELRFKQSGDDTGMPFSLDPSSKQQIIQAMERHHSESARKLRRLHPEQSENIGVKEPSSLQRMNINDTYSHFQDELSSHLSKLMDVLEQEKVKVPEEKPKKKEKKEEKVEVVNVIKEVKEDDLYSFFKHLQIENRFSLEYDHNSESRYGRVYGQSWQVS